MENKLISKILGFGGFELQKGKVSITLFPAPAKAIKTAGVAQCTPGGNVYNIAKKMADGSIAYGWSDESICVEYASSTGERIAVLFDEDEIYAASSTGEEIDWDARNRNPLLAAVMVSREEDYLDQLISILKTGVEEAEKKHKDKIIQLVACLTEAVYRDIKDNVYDCIEEPEYLTDAQMAGFRITAGAGGTFEMFTADATTTSAATSTSMLSDLIGAFPVGDQQDVTVTRDIIVDDNLKRLAKKISISHSETFRGKPLSNIFLFGPAGTGKSTSAEALAAMAGKRLARLVCNANTEIFDITGQVMPVSTSGVSLEAKKKANEIAKRGGRAEDVWAVYGIPTEDDIMFDEELFFDDYGVSNLADLRTAVENARNAAMNEFLAARATEQHYEFTDTEFMDAVRNGGFIEIQEPNVILNEGVMVGLNSLFEEGVITLPTGEVVNRHPDCVIIMTSNVNYAGCRKMNQSVLDRCIIQKVEKPSMAAIVARIKMLSGLDDETVIEQVVTLCNEVSAAMADEGIDGEVGVRAMIDTCRNIALGDDARTAFIEGALYKASFDDEESDILMALFDASPLSVKRSRKRRI
jgi:DNA polymerase III delta prime subunit